jgi:D-amino-acid oxidase
MADVDVLVIGAGVSGLTTAVCLAESGSRVAVHATEPPAGTTSAVAGALWLPYLVEPADRVAAWGAATFAEFRTLAGDPTTGVRLAAGLVVSTTAADPPPWTEVMGAVPCPAGDLPPGYAAGWRVTAPLVTMPTYLGYLADRLRATGSRIETAPVSNLDEALAVAPVVVNCSGIGARELVPDPGVRPVRGQVVVVANPGLDEFFAEHPGPSSRQLRYVMPHGSTVVLGGTAEPGGTDRTPDPEVTRRIVARCTEVVPALAGARILAQRVGLRPARDEVRLEPEDRPAGRIVHNYGHGGGGVTLSWGCAREAAAHVR